jgi:hypothetical protein
MVIVLCHTNFMATFQFRENNPGGYDTEHHAGEVNSNAREVVRPTLRLHAVKVLEGAHFIV